MSKTKLPSVEELLERKNWTGLTARELAKAGRIGDPGEAAANIVRHLDLVTGPFGMGLDDMVWDLIDELRGLEDDLTTELKRLSEEKKLASSEQVLRPIDTDEIVEVVRALWEMVQDTHDLENVYLSSERKSFPNKKVEEVISTLSYAD